ncbi:hypothetical protein [Nostoc sp.]|uniref:hypothetical protein n=1 Tax=Nostoc sp. TaxID=1180 RepID=UPI002FF65E54
MTFATASDSWIKLTRENWLYLRLPKLGVVKVKMHRPIPDEFIIKQVSVTKKADGWFIQLILEDVNACGEHSRKSDLWMYSTTKEILKCDSLTSESR